MVKILCAIPVVLISAIYIALGAFMGFFAKTTLVFGVLFILAGALPLYLMYKTDLLQVRRKALMWGLGLGYAVLALLAALDEASINGLEWLSLLLGLVAGGITALCMRKIVPADDLTPA